MIDMLASIGVRKGAPFAPDEPLEQTLTDAVLEGREWLDAQCERYFDAPFFPGTHCFAGNGLPLGSLMAVRGPAIKGSADGAGCSHEARAA